MMRRLWTWLTPPSSHEGTWLEGKRLGNNWDALGAWIGAVLMFMAFGAIVLFLGIFVLRT